MSACGNIYLTECGGVVCGKILWVFSSGVCCKGLYLCKCDIWCLKNLSSSSVSLRLNRPNFLSSVSQTDKFHYWQFLIFRFWYCWDWEFLLQILIERIASKSADSFILWFNSTTLQRDQRKNYFRIQFWCWWKVSMKIEIINWRSMQMCGPTLKHRSNQIAQRLALPFGQHTNQPPKNTWPFNQRECLFKRQKRWWAYAYANGGHFRKKPK